MRDADDAAWHLWDRDLRAVRKSPQTIEAYRYAVDSLAGWLEREAPAADLLGAGHDEIAGWLAGLAGKVEARQLSSNTMATYARRVRTFYTHMIAAGYHDGPHPMIAIERVKEDETLMPCPEEADVAAVIAACEGKTWRDRRDMAIVRVLCEAGTPRAFELGGIELPDLNLRADSLMLRGKGGRERRIALGAKSCRALTLWVRARQGLRLAAEPATKNLLFFSKYGPINKDSLNDIIARRCQQAGVSHIRPHDFRRFTYDKWDAQDGNTGAAMMLWGWITPTMPTLYGRQNAGRRAVTHARVLSLGDQI